MWRTTLKGVLAHKLRLALTSLAIVLGVAFVAGTFVLTDTIGHTFDRLFTEVNAGVDAVVRSKAAFSGTMGEDTDREPIADSVVAAVRRIDGVAAAEGFVQGYAQMVDRDGEAIGSQAPTFGASWSGTADLNPFDIKAGRAPRGPGEVVIDAGTAEDHDLGVGQRVKVLLTGPAERFTVVGTASFGALDNLAGATFALFDLPTAQRVLDREGTVDEIAVVAEEGVPASLLVQRLRAALPPGTEAISGTDATDEARADVKEGLRFVTTALLVFAAVALLVGSFIILNTFSILVAQRTRELALLRALGASRRQVTGSVLGEALIVGAFSSVVGLGLGILMAIGLKALLEALGIDLPTGPTQVLPRTAVVAMVVGVGVTAFSALLPARRAARVAPVAAMREPEPTDGGSLRRRAVAGTVVTVAGAAALLFGLLGDGGIEVTGLGALLTFVGVAVFSPLVARPVAATVGAPLAVVFRVPGKLGRENAMRNPRRTAATAAALMIGLALVAFMTILFASVEESAGRAIDETAGKTDFILTAKGFGSFSPALAAGLRDRPEIDTTIGFRGGQAKIDGRRSFIQAADHEGLERVLNIDLKAGRVADLADGGLMVWEAEADRRGWTVGDVVRVEFARTGVQRLRIDGVYGDNRLLGDHLLSLRDFEANFTEQLDGVVAVKAAEGVSAADARVAVESVARDFPNVEVSDRAEFKEKQEDQIGQVLNLAIGLLVLSVVIALFGITNTLALSIYERTREVGLLRAVGMSRRQLRRMVRWESVIISVMGALLGLAVGLFFAWAMVQALADEGIDTFRVPVRPLLVFLVVAALAGMAAAVLPARRAARLNVLRAIAHE